jgi:hypothetical protein
MHNKKFYFKTPNGSLAMGHIGVVMIEQYEPAQQLKKTRPFHCQFALWKSNYALFIFCGQRV